MQHAPNPDLYRPNVGLALFHPSGLVLLARRLHAPPPYAWQMPQGGIDPGESTLDAALRELEEEIGVTADLVEVLEELPDWLHYDFPPEVLERERRRGRFIGQRQKWFALRFRGKDRDIRLDQHTPEFSEWRWARLAEAPDLIVPFKRPVYEIVRQRFHRHALGA